MMEYVDYYLLIGWTIGFLFYAFVNLYKGGDAFKFYVSLAISILFFEALK